MTRDSYSISIWIYVVGVVAGCALGLAAFYGILYGFRACGLT